MKRIVIAGNGPSIKDIDYRRLPKDIDIFRVNHFYKEDYYYLGKNINYYIPGSRSGLYDYLPIVFAKTMEGVYNIFEYIGVTLYDQYVTDYFSYLINFGQNNIVDTEKSNSIWSYIKLYRDYHKNYNSYLLLNTGTWAIFKAIEYGYKEIYIVGIELQGVNNWEHFYEEPDNCKYELSTHIRYHNEKFEKDLIKYMSILPGIKMYSISNSCGINEILELAPIQNDNPYIPVKKTKEEMELSEASLIFLEDVRNKIFKEWKKSKIHFYHNLSMDFDTFSNRLIELESEERAIEEEERKRIENINKLVWWIPIRKFRDKLRIRLLNKLKD